MSASLVAHMEVQAAHGGAGPDPDETLVDGGPLGLSVFGGGHGGIEELVENLREDRTQFGLLKFALGGGEHCSVVNAS